MTEVVQFLESLQPSSSTSPRDAGTVSRDSLSMQSCPLPLAGVVFPLTTGSLVAAAYLEWLVTKKSAPALIHDEYLNSLAQGVAAVKNSAGDAINEREVLANLNELLPSDTESLRLFKIYRRKLQHFLQVTFLPSYVNDIYILCVCRFVYNYF